jgi:hypothetical protein
MIRSGGRFHFETEVTLADAETEVALLSGGKRG